jgi:hypothetical protein
MTLFGLYECRTELKLVISRRRSSASARSLDAARPAYRGTPHESERFNLEHIDTASASQAMLVGEPPR